MNIDSVGKYIGSKQKSDVVRGAHYFIGLIVVLTIILFCLSFFNKESFLNKIENPKELIQAVLVCSTALMGLSGLILIEIRKTDILLPDDKFEQINALNSIIDFLRAAIILRWSLFLSFIAIIFSCLQFIENNSLYMTISLASFFAQLVFFLYGLLFSRFLPGSIS